MTTSYSELQLDALRELANVGSGTAATALSSMLGQPVDISVPAALALPLADAVDATGASDSLKLKVAAQYLAAGKRERAIDILSRLPGGSDLAQRRDLLLALAKGANQSPEAARAAIDAVAAKYVDDPALQRSVAILHAARGDYDAARAAFIARQPMGRIGMPEEIADLVVYLAGATYTTGQIHVIDGGVPRLAASGVRLVSSDAAVA